MSSHGSRANKTGKTLESIVIPVLTSQYGFAVWPYSRYRSALQTKATLVEEVLPKRLLIQRVPYTTLYGGEGTTEFMLRAEDAYHTHEFPVENSHGELVCRIECKWQQTSGSVDEKFPYLYLSCVEAIPEKNIIILHGGGKYRVGAIQWLKQAVAGKKYFSEASLPKNIRVMGVEDFMTWVSRAFDSYPRT